MGDHIEKLTDVFCSKLKIYFMQIGTLLQKKSITLFNFEELNIRCFYHRLRDFYKSQGMDNLDELMKSGHPSFAKTRKMIQLAQNTTEKTSGSKLAKSSLMLERKVAAKNQSSRIR
jgi:hypothetical protein